MHPEELLILLTAICACALLAHRLRIASPIAFLLGGLALALAPGMPEIEINPESVFFVTE